MPLLNVYQLSKKRILQIFRSLEAQGTDMSMMSDAKLNKKINEHYKMSLNATKRWRKELEKDGKILPPKTRDMSKPKYTKYKSAYLDLIGEKQKTGKKIVMRKIADELSEKFKEEVTNHIVYS